MFYVFPNGLKTWFIAGFVMVCQGIRADDLFDNFKRDSPQAVEYSLRFGNVANVQGLEVKNTEWELLPEQLEGYTQLRFLRIRHSKITLQQSDLVLLKKLTKLEYLEISSSQIQDLPTAFVELMSLRVIVLNRNRIRSLQSWPRLEHIEVLKLAMNEIERFGPVAGFVPRARELDLSGNKLKDLDGLEIMNDVQIALLSRNQISRLCARIPSSIEVLDLSYNEIEEFPDDWFLDTTVRSLLFADNRLLAIPQSIKECRLLRFVSFARNQIRVVPVELVLLNNIERIDLNGNDLLREGRLNITRGSGVINLNIN